MDTAAVRAGPYEGRVRQTEDAYQITGTVVHPISTVQYRPRREPHRQPSFCKLGSFHPLVMQRAIIVAVAKPWEMEKTRPAMISNGFGQPWCSLIRLGCAPDRQ